MKKEDKIKLIGKIKNVKRVDNRDKKDNSIINFYIELEVEYEYESKKQTSTLNITTKIDENEFKVGDDIEFFYNPNTKEISEIANNIFKSNPLFRVVIAAWGILFVYCLIYGLFFEKSESIIPQAIAIILAVIVWYLQIYILYDKDYAKNKNKFIKLKGNVIDYHVHYGGGLDNEYFPEILFKYNNKENKYISGLSSNRKKYEIGQEVELSYNPETGRIYEKNNNKFLNIFIVIPPIIGIIALIIKLF